MKYTVNEIGERVYALLDENREILDERMEYADPGVSLSSLIRMLLLDSARSVLLSAPLDEVDECKHLDSVSGLQHSGEEHALFAAPQDFLRLVWLRMSDWPVGVSSPLVVGSEEYRLRFRPHPGRVRSRRAPAVAILRRGDRVSIEVFGTVKGARVVEFDYIAQPAISNEAIDLPPALMPEVCAHLAGRIREILSG